MGTKLPNTKVLETYLQDLRSDRPQPTPARSLKPQESKLEQPASANASRSPDVIKAIDLDSDESPKADSVGYSPTTPAESGHGSVAPKEPPKVYTDVGPFGDFVTTDTEIPDYCDTNAPKFEKHEHHLSENAIRCRARRIFTPRVDGSKKVSETVFKEWHSKGQPRKNLEQIFKQCGYDPESLSEHGFIFSICFRNDYVSCFSTVYSRCNPIVLNPEMQSTEFEIEAEFLTHDEMESRGMTESLF